MVNIFCKFRFVAHAYILCGTLSEVKCLQAQCFFFLTADTLQQHANTKTLALWRHVSFAKRGATLTKSLPPQKKKKRESSEYSSKYEQEQRKRTRAFLPLWQQNRS